MHCGVRKTPATHPFHDCCLSVLSVIQGMRGSANPEAVSAFRQWPCWLALLMQDLVVVDNGPTADRHPAELRLLGSLSVGKSGYRKIGFAPQWMLIRVCRCFGRDAGGPSGVWAGARQGTLVWGEQFGRTRFCPGLREKTN